MEPLYIRDDIPIGMKTIPVEKLEVTQSNGSIGIGDNYLKINYKIGDLTFYSESDLFVKKSRFIRL